MKKIITITLKALAAIAFACIFAETDNYQFLWTIGSALVFAALALAICKVDKVDNNA